MARIAVVGVGAIGGAIAAPLAALGRHELVSCVRRPFARLVLEAPGGRIELAARCATDPGAVGPVDWVLLATKAHEVAGAAGWLEALARPGVRLAVLQNGVEHRERVAPFARGAEVLPVVVELPAERRGPGHVVQRAPARLTAPEGEVGRAFAQLFAGTGIAVETTADFASAAWRKLCFNAATGGLTALTSRAIEVAREPGMLELARGLLRECIAVARAEGAALPDALADEIPARLGSMPGWAGNSLLADRRAGRPLETDARHGAVVRLGARHGIATPLNAAVAAILDAQLPGGGPEEVLEFWLAGAELEVARASERMKLWFADDPELDREVARRFAARLELALDGELRGWERAPRARLALVLLLDQLARNAHRGTPRAFAGDARALALAREALASGADRALRPLERAFLLLPLEHAEDRDAQRESVARFRALEADAPAEWRALLAEFTRYAEAHAEIVLRFGRFPHRNAVLGRESTPEERAYLSGDAPDFGQHRR